MSACDHKFVHGGLVFYYATYSSPGTSARDRIYEDWFYCEKCLENKYTNKRTVGHSFTNPISGSSPKGDQR